MQIADVSVPNGLPTAEVAVSPSAAAPDFTQLFGDLLRGDGVAEQAAPQPSQDPAASAGEIVASEALADVKQTMRISEASDGGRDLTALDPSGTPLGLALLMGVVAPLLTLPVTPVVTDPEPAPSQEPAPQPSAVLSGSTQLTTGGFDKLTTGLAEGALSAGDRMLDHGLAKTFALSALPPLAEVGGAETPASIERSADHPLAAAVQRSALKVQGATVEGQAQVATATELPGQGPVLSHVEARPELSRGGPVLTRVGGEAIAPGRISERAEPRLVATDETSDSEAGVTAITAAHDRPAGASVADVTPAAGMPPQLKERLPAQERPGSRPEGDDRSPEAASPAGAPEHGRGPNAGDLSSTRADAPRSGASAVVERDRSVVLQVAQQIVAAARSGLGEDGASVRLRLRPESLGELLIKISWKEKGLVAAIQAASPVAAKLLEADLGHLKASLGERGIAVSHLGVQVGLDLRHGSGHGDPLPPAATSGMVQEARPWRVRDDVPTLASLIQREGLIDIRV